MATPSTSQRTYGARASLHKNEAAKRLLQIMEEKKTNLCVSVDVTTKDAFLRVVDTVGPYACLIKTHIDIIEDFDHDLIARLQSLSEQHKFLIFEDRKFADIGNTVTLQYAKGVHRIASWAHITNAHVVPGPGIISGLTSVGLPLGRGLLLLAEMSSKGSLATGQYSIEAIRMARANKDFVIGFIGQNRALLATDADGTSITEEDFLLMSPGVSLDSSGDSMEQQYRSPKDVIVGSGCDIIIVGRGIYGNGDSAIVRQQAERYRQAGWQAYEERLGSN